MIFWGGGGGRTQISRGRGRLPQSETPSTDPVYCSGFPYDFWVDFSSARVNFGPSQSRVKSSQEQELVASHDCCVKPEMPPTPARIVYSKSGCSSLPRKVSSDDHAICSADGPKSAEKCMCGVYGHCVLDCIVLKMKQNLPQLICSTARPFLTS